MNTKTFVSFVGCFVLVYSVHVCPVSGERSGRLVLDSEQDFITMITTLQTRVLALENEIADLKSNSATTPLTSGSTYVRWGRTSCPGNGTEFVFSGRMAGSKWDSHGGGSNSVCLPDDPTWGKYVDGANSGGAIHGTEIELGDGNANVLFGKPINNEDVPCSLCRTARPSAVMIAGRASCYPGWTLEYHGYVVASNPTWNNNADYVCLDAGLELAPHGGANDNDHVINVVEARCGGAGSLPCPPYVDGRELACVVCSK